MTSMKTYLWACVAASVGTLNLSASSAPSPMTVYTVDGLTRVRPHDAPRAAQPVHIKAARNEYEPFQVVVRAGEERLKGVNMEVSDLRSARGSIISRQHIAFFREHYVEVKKPSPKSKEGAGWYPDALIPFVNPIDGKPLKGGRFVAAPFDVPPNTNQPVWVEVFVPKDAAAGDYTGTVTVTAQNQKAVTISVKLTVWDFALPDMPSMRSNFGYLGHRVANAHKMNANAPEFRAIERRYAEAMAAHRLCPPIPPYLQPKVNPDGSVDPTETHAALKEWMERFHVNGFPLRLLSADTKDRERSVKHLQTMFAYLKQNGWEKFAYIYVLDEPNDADAYEQVRQRAKIVHEAQPGIKVLCTEQPTPSKPEWGTLVGSVDIWVPLWPLFEEKSGAERLAAGEELWSYTALCQGALADRFSAAELPHSNVDKLALWHDGFALLDDGLLGEGGRCVDEPPDNLRAVQRRRRAVLPRRGRGLRWSRCLHAIEADPRRHGGLRILQTSRGCWRQGVCESDGPAPRAQLDGVGDGCLASLSGA